MSLTPEDIAVLEVLAATNPVCAKVLEEYNKLIKSPFLEGYLTVYRQITEWNKEIEDDSKSIKIVQMEYQNATGQWVKSSDKSFDNAHKYLKEIQLLYDKLEWFRGKLTEEEIRIVDKLTLKKKGSQVVV